MISNSPQSAWNEPPRVSWRPFRLGEAPHLSRQGSNSKRSRTKKVRNRAVWSLLARVLSLEKLQNDTPKQGYQSKGQASKEPLCTSFLRAGREKAPQAFTCCLAGKIRATCIANPRNEERRCWFLVPLFSNGNEPAGPLFSFRFLPFALLDGRSILPARRPHHRHRHFHGARRWAMRRGRELITGGGGAPRASSRAHVIRRFASCFGRSQANSSTSCAVPKHTTCLLSGVDRRYNTLAHYDIRRRTFSSTTSGTINNDRNQRLIHETQNWLDRIVIGQKLCPFAPPVRSPPRLRMVASEATDADQLVEQMSAEADLLVAGLMSNNGDGDNGDNGDDGDIGDNNTIDTDDDDGISLPPQTSSFPETTLVILNAQNFPAMSDYRNLIRLSWRIQSDCIIDRGHSDHLQLVLFHPLAVHDTYPA